MTKAECEPLEDLSYQKYKWIVDNEIGIIYDIILNDYWNFKGKLRFIKINITAFGISFKMKVINMKNENLS